MAKELLSALEEIGLTEAIEDVLPIVDKLATDSDETVKETFASELDRILLYFYKVIPRISKCKNKLYTKLTFTFRMCLICSPVLMNQHLKKRVLHLQL
jgi:hypothetical protein